MSRVKSAPRAARAVKPAMKYAQPREVIEYGPVENGGRGGGVYERALGWGGCGASPYVSTGIATTMPTDLINPIAPGAAHQQNVSCSQGYDNYNPYQQGMGMGDGGYVRPLGWGSCDNGPYDSTGIATTMPIGAMGAPQMAYAPENYYFGQQQAGCASANPQSYSAIFN